MDFIPVERQAIGFERFTETFVEVRIICGCLLRELRLGR